MIAKRLAGLLALGVILALLAGVPVLLLWLGAPFLPDTLPSWTDITTALTSRDDGTLIVGLLFVAAWLAWAYLAVALLIETVAAIRRIPAPAVPGFRLPQGIAQQLVGVALMAFLAAPTLAHATPSTPHRNRRPPPRSTPVVPSSSKATTLMRNQFLVSSSMKCRAGTLSGHWLRTISGTHCATLRSSKPTKGSRNPTVDP